jgi:hypothetical protein
MIRRNKSIKGGKTMLWTRKGFSVVSLLAAALWVAACSGGGPSKEDLAKEAEWTWLNDTKVELDAKRLELADLKTQLAEMAGEAAAEEEGEAASGEEGEAASGEEGEAEAVDPATRAEQLQQEVDQLTEEYGGRLVALVNADAPFEGEEPSERHVALIRMKSDEDIVMAREWIEKGGDYKRAIEIYTTALLFDPGNERVQEALAEAESLRYMTEERFAMAKKGMNQDEVRQALGQPNLHNVREFPERNVVAWFYPTSAGGSAAAVWFQPDKREELKAYKLDFKGIKGQGEEAGS